MEICRSCGESSLRLVLPLRRMPLANSLLTASQLNLPEETYPLDLVFCDNCTLVQISETVPPEKLFREYLYFSSYSDTMLRHAKDLAEELIETRGLGSGSLVVEPASNDGYLLQYFVAKSIPVLGIEPARNIAKAAEAKGVRTLPDFFDSKLARTLRNDGKLADVLIANNVLAHVADLNGFVEGIRILLKQDGVAVVEVPYVKDMIERNEFDTIYHEHLCYYSLSSLNRLFNRHGMVITDVQRIDIHGGSLRVFVSHQNQARPSPRAETLMTQEHASGVDKLEFYLNFGKKVEGLKESLVLLLRSLRSKGHCIAAYGAAAKGTVLLNYCGISKDLIDFVVDRNPHKQDHYMPGVHLPIYSPSRLLQDRPAYTLLLAWNFATEILEQQSEYRDQGGKFIIPIPELKVV